MGVFPQLGIINEKITNTINGRIGNNVAVSKLIPWIRIASAGSAATTGVETVSPAGKSSLTSQGNSAFGSRSVITGNATADSKGLVLESISPNNSFAASYGGIIDKEQKSGRVGVDFNGNSVYADGADRAHRPSPTIESLTIEDGNKGLSKKASFSITCYTLSQLETVSEYFLEPGYVVLVEFGYNTRESINQKANLKGSNGPCEIARYNNYEYILDKRVNSGGTYDGFMGYITDGGITNGENETYTIDVTLTTLGEIPAYLQMHKNGSTSDIIGDELKNAKHPNKFYTSDIDEKSGYFTYGMALFMQMFNRLPAEKQTIAVKNLWNAKDINGNPYTLPGNYINMDDEVRKKIGELGGKKYKVTTADGKSSNIELPDGLDFITNQSFIRMELAFEIINKYAVNIDTTIGLCGDTKPFDFRINALYTVCRAHKNIFSTDLSKVYVPNSQLPNFGLENVFSTTPVEVFLDVNNIKNTVDGSFFPGLIDKYAFPSTVDYVDDKLKDTTPISATSYTWGYLRNLYINFDFFIEVISKTNLVAKDVYYEILNGVSAAVNSYWEFDLYKTPAKSKTDTHSYELSVRDATFSGNISKKTKMTEWTMSGINTPFLSAKMDISIPAAMRNHTLGLRSSAKVQTQIEGNPQEYLFAQGEDRVLKILNSFKEKQTAEIDEFATTETPDADDIQKANLDLFLNRAVMIPKIQQRGRDLDNILGIWKQKLTDIFIIAGWNDSILLNDVRMINEHVINKTLPVGTIANPAILSLGFDFDLIGISGIKVGDVFKIKDLPKQFKNHGIFQVMEISHALSNGTWTTSVKSKMRNM